MLWLEECYASFEKAFARALEQDGVIEGEYRDVGAGI